MKRKKIEYKAAPMDMPRTAPVVPEMEEKSAVLKEPEAVYMVEKVRDGLPFDEFHALREMLGITEERLGGMIGMSRATLHRRKKAGHLDRSESDRLVRYGRILSSAMQLFQDYAKAAKWLTSPAIAFQGETPLEYSDTEIGAREVEALLGRIQHGVFS